MRPSRLVVATLVLWLTLPSAARADIVAPAPPAPATAETAAAPPSPSDTRRLLSVGLNLYQFDYVETLQPPLRSAEKGFLPAIQARFDLKAPADSWFLAAILDTSLLSTTYEGTLQSSNPALNGLPLSYSHASTILQLEGHGGMRFVTVAGIHLDGYIGLGYRLWSRGQPSDGVGSYKEDYQWMYVPLGIRFSYDISEAIDVALDMSARFPFGGRIKFFFSGANPTIADTEAILGGNKVGFRAQAPVRLRKLFAPVGLVATPWFEYSAIGAGPPAALIVNGALSGTASEPASRTYQYGIVVAAEIPL